jgi:ATP-dependent exoDNAse (exonuclease V) alpha subunit
VETLRKEGLSAETVQSFLLSRQQPPGQPELWILDEAGMLGARDMRDLLQRAEEQNARVVLAGDARQFGSVPAGRSFEQLLESGLPSVELTKIVRQERAPEAIREAVAQAFRGETRQALERLSEGGWVHAIRDEAGRYRKAAELYATLPGENLVVCATNEERKRLNAAIREARKEKGEVERDGLTTEVHLPKNLSRSGRKDARHYETGDAVRFHFVRPGGPLEKGVWYRVVGRDLLTNRVTVQGPDGGKVRYNPKDHYGVEDVFRVEEREFAVGDLVRLGRKDAAAKLVSGQVATVVALDPGGTLTLQTRAGDRREVDLSRYKTLDYAYASTGHSAQSRTVDNVIVLLTSRHRLEVVNRASFYVGASRTRGELHLIVDDYERAVAALEREHKKSAALDIVPPARPGLERSLALARGA